MKREITSKYRLWLIDHGYAESQAELDRNKLEDKKRKMKLTQFDIESINKI